MELVQQQPHQPQEGVVFALVINDDCPEVAGLFLSEGAAQAAYSADEHGALAQVFRVPLHRVTCFMSQPDAYCTSVFARPCTADGWWGAATWMSHSDAGKHARAFEDAKRARQIAAREASAAADAARKRLQQ